MPPKMSEGEGYGAKTTQRLHFFWLPFTSVSFTHYTGNNTCMQAEAEACLACGSCVAKLIEKSLSSNNFDQSNDSERYTVFEPLLLLDATILLLNTYEAWRTICAFASLCY